MPIEDKEKESWYSNKMLLTYILLLIGLYVVSYVIMRSSGYIKYTQGSREGGGMRAWLYIGDGTGWETTVINNFYLPTREGEKFLIGSPIRE